jgi:hypothetical protein
MQLGGKTGAKKETLFAKKETYFVKGDLWLWSEGLKNMCD